MSKKCSTSRIVAVFLLGFVIGQCAGPGCARAEEPPAVGILAAAHEGELAHAGILWRSTYQLTPAQEVTADRLRLVMAVPLPPEVVVQPGDPPSAPVYDEQGRLVQRDVIRGDRLVHRHSWTFDKAGRLDVYREEDPPEGRVATYDHAYDDEGRLLDKHLR